MAGQSCSRLIAAHPGTFLRSAVSI